ncbi:synaptotagmin-4-like [Brevipalpus obovatus]|uniref:synaptotagmin-4-like n=1 Tax=Brevipalpus obovatus TaxID=246614 RepID=UPI003D9F7D6C
MRLQSLPYHLEKSEHRSVEQGNGSFIIALSVGSAVIVIISAALVYLLHRRRQNSGEGHTTLLLKRSPVNEIPFTFKKSSAVKSSQTPPGPTLKKSPTGCRSPPGGNVCISPVSPKDRDQESPRSESKSTEFESAKEISSELKKPTSSAITNERIDSVSPISTKNNVDKGNLIKPCGSIPNKPENLPLENSKPEPIARKLGQLYFKLKYNYEKQALCVIIEKCSGLCSERDGNQELDPYVKLQLIPSKQHKVKTRVLRRTANPVYDEEFVFYGITADMLATTNLQFMVLSFDRYSRDNVIGKIYYQLDHLHFDTLEKQISVVQDLSPPSLRIQSQGKGEILISLCYAPAASRLTVVILKARGLPKMDNGISGLCDPFVKIYLNYKNQRIAKKKTHVKKHTLDPVFNESFVFDVPQGEGLDNLSLEFTMFDYDRVTRNEVVGKVEVGMKAQGNGAKHWRDVAASPRRQIAEWHKLQEV